MFAIFKREFKSYFITPLGYVFIGVYLLFSGAFFYLFTLTSWAPTAGNADFSTMFALMFFVLMVTIPLLTMRLFAEERRNKTDQLTLTAPVSLVGIVLAKFSAAYAVFLISTAVMPVYGIVLEQFGVELSWITLLGNIAGLQLLGGVFTAVGLLVSTLTENQMIAAIISIFANIAFLLASIAAPHVKIAVASDALNALSLYERYNKFTIGIFEITNLLFFISAVAVLLFLTVRILERRRWS